MPFDKSQALNAATAHLLQGNTQAAISVYLKIIEANPEDLSMINRLGDLYASEGRVRDAINEFSRVADSCLASGLTRKAIALLRKIAALDPGNTETSFKLAGAYTQAGLPSDARQQYLQIAEDYTRKGQTLDALAVYCKIVVLDPLNTSTRIKLGELYLREGLNEQAYETFITAADQLALNGEHRRALNAYNEALAIRPDGAEALAGVSRIPLTDSGALTDKPRAIDSLSLSGLLREPHPSGEPESLRDSAALDQSPDGEDSTFVVQEISKAEMLVAYGQVGQAISMLNNVATSLPENIDVRIKLKDIYLRNGMMAEASAECRKLELIYQARGDDSRARDYAMRAGKLTRQIEHPSDDLHSPTAVRVKAPALSEAPSAAGITPKPGNHGASRINPEPALLKTVTSRPISPTAEHQLPAPLHMVRQQEPAPAALLKPEPKPINRTALEVSSSRPIDVVAVSVRPGLPVASQIVRKRSRVAVAGIAAGVLLTIGVGATVGGLIYDNHLNKQYEALTLISPEASASLAVSTPQESEPAQNTESITVDGTPDVTPATKSETPREQALDHRSIVSEQPAAIPAPSEQARPVQASPSPLPPSTNVNADNRSTTDSRTPTGVPATVPAGSAVPAAPPPRVVTQSSGVVLGAAVKRVEPGYPDVARQNKQLGSVRVEVGIDEQGNVTSARALSGPLLLQNAAVGAARGWKFKPSTMAGVPVKTTTVIVFNFKL